MVSEDFKRLVELVFNKNYRIDSIKIKLERIPNKPPGCFLPTSNIILKKDKQTITFKSEEYDVSEFSFSLHHTINKEGDMEFMSYKDLNKYYEDIDFLIDEDKKKIPNTIQKLQKGEFKFDYDPETLFRGFISSDRRSSLKFKSLKKDYFEIRSHFLLLSRDILLILERTKKENPEFKEYCELVDDILMKAFRNNSNFLKNYSKYIQYAQFDLKNLAEKAKEEKDHAQDLFDMLSKRGKIKGDRGIKYLLDIYRRTSELLSPFINFIRISIELAEGNNSPEQNKKYVENWEIIKNSNTYSNLVKHLDPRIRHSESHLNTEIDKTKGKVLIYENKKGNKIKLVEYTFQEICDMTKNLQNSLLPAFNISFALHNLVVIDIILQSKTYLLILLGIGNRK